MKNLFKKKHTNENTYKTYIDSALEEKILKIIHSSKAEIINLAPHYKDREFTKSDCQEVFSLADRKFQNIHSTINLHSQAEYREGLINSEVENSERIVLGFNREREDLKKEKLILEREKTAFQPQVIFTHHGGDVNIDHQRTFEAGITATRPMSHEIVKTIITFETPSGTEWRGTNRILNQDKHKHTASI